jgi:magnesium transporter
MITVYANIDGALQRGEFPGNERLHEGVVWLDLFEPTQAETSAVERALDIESPTREEMQEIELSSRVYRDGDASYMTASLIYDADTDEPKTTQVTFIRTPRALVTLRYAEPKSFRMFQARALRQPNTCPNGDAALIGLLDTITDRAADVLESVGNRLDDLSREIFRSRRSTKKPSADATDLETVVLRLGRNEDLTSRMQDSLLSLGRILTFLGAAGQEQRASKDFRQRVKTLNRDVHALQEHSAVLAHKGGFLLDATLGLINVKQTNIIKIFSVASVAMMPPTLLASIWGMNIRAMPELDWPWMYPVAIGLMVVSAVLPYMYFKRRGWM